LPHLCIAHFLIHRIHLTLGQIPVLSGMKVIKFQAWEESFQDRILSLREVELRQLLRYFVGSTISRMFWVVTPLLVALSTFASYVWSGHKLDVASALTALALFDILRFPLFMLPQGTYLDNRIESIRFVACSFAMRNHHPTLSCLLIHTVRSYQQHCRGVCRFESSSLFLIMRRT
jgi:hypothetical protein